MDLEEELQDVPVGGPPGIDDDLDRLGMTRMVALGRVVVLPSGVADAGGDDSGPVAQQFLRDPETAPGEDRGLGVLALRGPSSDVVLKIIAEGLLARPQVRSLRSMRRALGARPSTRARGHLGRAAEDSASRRARGKITCHADGGLSRTKS